jgi:hypothetical protein
MDPALQTGQHGPTEWTSFSFERENSPAVGI